MVERSLLLPGIRDARVLEAMQAVPREEFVPAELRSLAWHDGPLPIGRGQTISQPYVVAYMLQALRLRRDDRALEVGSGSGYAAAVLSRIVAEVHGVELEEELHARSVETLTRLGYGNVHLRCGDGFLGWPEAAPFDAILLSCATGEVPPPLWDQLGEGGRLLYPRGPEHGEQELVLVTRRDGAPIERVLELVRFVPLRRAP